MMIPTVVRTGAAHVDAELARAAHPLRARRGCRPSQRSPAARSPKDS